MVTEKLNEYITSKGISMYAFENSLGVSRGSISKAVKENKSIGSQVLENILSTYTDLNPDWLLTGRGSMLRADGTPTMRATPSTNASTPSDAIALRLMDKLDEKDNIIKEKEVENKHLQSELRQKSEELAAIKALHSQSQNKESDHHTKISEVIENFTSDSSGDYGEDYSPTKPHTTSKRSSAGKI
mgnify:FL=1